MAADKASIRIGDQRRICFAWPDQNVGIIKNSKAMRLSLTLGAHLGARFS
jgi:plasmid maintenance system killer protein